MSQADRDQVMALPLVKAVMDVFEARLIDVRPDTPPAGPAENETPDESRDA